MHLITDIVYTLEGKNTIMKLQAVFACFLLVIKRPEEHSAHNLCVEAPFLNAAKGQEVVIQHRNYGCTWQYGVK